MLPELRVTRETADAVEQMFSKPLTAIETAGWSKNTYASLRKSLIRAMQQHVERKFLTVPLLEAL